MTNSIGPNGTYLHACKREGHAIDCFASSTDLESGRNKRKRYVIAHAVQLRELNPRMRTRQRQSFHFACGELH
jgi:hypothetical protein